MLPKTYQYRCEACYNEFVALVEYELRETTGCPECGNMAKRIWSGWTMNVSTRNSASVPAPVASGRFDNLRTKQQLVKEKAAARVSGDRESEKKLDKEIKKV